MLKQYFINNIKERFPNNLFKYDYSLVPNEFKIRNKVNIKIICNTHGVFEQRYDSHLQGKGCSKCSNCYKPNTKEFIEKSKQIHNNKYDYSKVDYIDSNTKVIITCKIHGDFEQTANSHLCGKGCRKCSNDSKKSNKEEFIIKANKIHNRKYNYDKVNYVNTHTKITITCNTHGDFLQRTSAHLNGAGCPRCKDSKGEKHISNILDNLNIKYIREYRISGYNYRYDFYLPEYNIYIEYHGIQHYKSFRIFGGKKGFNKIKRRDKSKIELVKRSNGLLIILDYKLNTLELIRDEIINIFNLLNPKFLSDREFTKDYINNSKVYLYNNGIMYIRRGEVK